MKDGKQMNINNTPNYHDKQNIDNINKMRDVLETLPKFCKQFFRGIADTTSARTRLAYAYDIRLFLSSCMKRTATVQGWRSGTTLSHCWTG